jgi:UDP-N-acetylmuramate--alanine ligase
MSSLARFALQRGLQVSGSDCGNSAEKKELRTAGARVFDEHDASQIDGADTVVISSAIPAHNVEWQAALRSGTRVLKRGELLAEWLNAHPGGIAVCGTHGKGSSASLLIDMLRAAGHRVSFVLGARRRDAFGDAHYEEDAAFFVAEVDESDRTHLAHRPRHLLLTNIEVDHLSTYACADAIIEAFEGLALAFEARRREDGLGHFVLGSYSPESDELERRLRGHCSWRSCSTQRAAYYHGELEGAEIVLHRGGERVGAFSHPLWGELHARNVVAAAAMAMELGVGAAAVAAGLAEHRGLRDRFELLRREPLIVTDYSSHPTCFSANLQELRQHLPEAGRLHAVFHPYRYSLLHHFWGAYIEALSLADAVYLLPMDGAGEPPLPGIGGSELAAALRERGLSLCEVSQLDELHRLLASQLSASDALIVFGGGPLFELARSLAAHFGVRVAR